MQLCIKTGHSVICLLKFTKTMFSVFNSTSKRSKLIAVLGPDGSGKTTFINELLIGINSIFISQGRIRKYHFKPSFLPDLSRIVKKVGIKVEEIDIAKPHELKPANKMSSFLRLCYYWIDYAFLVPGIKWKSARHNHFVIFDRYAYDFLVDPIRSRIKSPDWIRKLMLRITPKPDITFALIANPEVIHLRKKELTTDEITRQNEELKKLSEQYPNFFILNANKSPEEVAKQAIIILWDQYRYSNGLPELRMVDRYGS